MDKNHVEAWWISLILRFSIASLFVAAVVPKFTGGLDGVVMNFQNTFKDTWLPPALVTLYARFIPFIEVIIPIWLISGFKLRVAWVFTVVVLISLAFGMAVAKHYDVAADNFFYVMMACLGLYVSQFDRCQIGCGCKK